MRELAILLFSLLAVSCGPSAKPVPLHGGDSDGPLADDVEVAIWSWHDPFGASDQAVGLRLQLRSTAEHVLQNCALSFDRRYRASLADLELYRGVFGGNEPRGRSDLRPGESVELKFHHDNNNYLLLRDSDGSTIPTGSVPTAITVSCDGQERTWEQGS